MKISVVIPAYNAEKFIERALNSVLKQSFEPFEIIVVDDGSQDSTAEKIKKFSNVIIISQINKGEGSARNAGIKAAKGDYVAFLDSDDEWLGDHLLNAYKAFSLYPNCHVYSDGHQIMKEGTSHKLAVCLSKSDPDSIVACDYFKALPPKAYFSSSTNVISLESLRNIGLYNIQMKVGADRDVLFRIALKYKEFLFVNQLGAIVWARPDSLSRGQSKNINKSIESYQKWISLAKEQGDYERAKPRLALWVGNNLKKSIARMNIGATLLIIRKFWFLLPQIIRKKFI